VGKAALGQCTWLLEELMIRKAGNEEVGGQRILKEQCPREKIE
jgi:hypothetical protein